MAPKRKSYSVSSAREKATPSSTYSASKKTLGIDKPPESESHWRYNPHSPFDGEHWWPAPAKDMQEATAFLRRLIPVQLDTEISTSSSPSSSKDSAISLSTDHPLVLLPDKDADGLCSTLILHRTLIHLGVNADHIHIHHVQKANHAASGLEASIIRALRPAAVILLDQGSRPGPPLLGHGDTTPVLVIDHHFLKSGETGPRGSFMLNSCHSLPAATSSLLCWCLCRPMWSAEAEQKAQDEIDWLAVLGTVGDLNFNVAWDPPWPDLSPQVKKWTKKRISTAIALLNAPRRTPEFDVNVAYASLRDAKTPVELLDPHCNVNAVRLYAAREAVTKELERCTHTPPKFSKDGRVAVLFISSPYQVHPGIATRWSGALRGAKKLQVVMVANSGYSPTGTHTHFSCRRAQVSLKRGENPNIIALLHEYAARDPTFLDGVASAESFAMSEDANREGPTTNEDTKGALNFARGHKEASGGILPHALFQRFIELMEVGFPPEKGHGFHEERGGKNKKAKTMPDQKTKLTSFFAAAPTQTSPAKAR